MVRPPFGAVETNALVFGFSSSLELGVGCSSEEVSEDVGAGEGSAEDDWDEVVELDEDEGAAEVDESDDDDPEGAVEGELDDEEPVEESDDDDDDEEEDEDGLADGEGAFEVSGRRPPLEEVDDVVDDPGVGVTAEGGLTSAVGDIVGLVVPTTGGAELEVVLEDSSVPGLSWGKPPPIRVRASSAILTKSSSKALSASSARAAMAWCFRGSLGAFATVDATSGSTYSSDRTRIVSVMS